MKTVSTTNLFLIILSTLKGEMSCTSGFHTGFFGLGGGVGSTPLPATPPPRNFSVHIICINHYCADFSIIINFSQILGGGGESQFPPPPPLYETLHLELSTLRRAHSPPGGRRVEALLR